MSTSNDITTQKKSKLSRSRKIGKKEGSSHKVVPKAVLEITDLNETCDFKDPMTPALKGPERCDFINRQSQSKDTKDNLRKDSSQQDDDFVCQVCSKDISHMNSARRQQHVNRCIDRIEEKEQQENKLEELLQKAKKPVIPNCPVCRKAFKTCNARQTHLKKCAVIHNISTEEMLRKVKQQEEEAKTKLSVSAPIQHHSKTTTGSRTGQTKKQKIKEPHTQFDEDVQLAMAVSSSLVEQSKSDNEIVGDSLMHAAAGGKKKRKNNVMEDVCLVTTLTREAKQRRIEQRLMTVLLGEESDDSETESSPNFQPSTLNDAKTETRLWGVSNGLSDKTNAHDFYVSTLMPPIVVDKLPSGSRLKRLSSIHGRNVSFNVEQPENSHKANLSSNDDMFMATTQTAVVLAELAVNDSMVQADSQLYTSRLSCGFCEENLTMKAEVLNNSRMRVLNSYQEMINQEEWSDMKIKTADDFYVYGHKAIILTRFPDLKKRLDTTLSCMTLPISKEACLAFLTYTYTGELSCTPSIQQELIELSKKYQELHVLGEICGDLEHLEDLEEVEENKTSLSEFRDESHEASVVSDFVLNMKDIWGESDSDIEEMVVDKEKGAVTDTDKSGAVSDVDFSDTDGNRNIPRNDANTLSPSTTTFADHSLRKLDENESSISSNTSLEKENNDMELSGVADDESLDEVVLSGVAGNDKLEEMDLSGSVGNESHHKTDVGENSDAEIENQICNLNQTHSNMSSICDTSFSNMSEFVDSESNCDKILSDRDKQSNSPKTKILEPVRDIDNVRIVEHSSPAVNSNTGSAFDTSNYDLFESPISPCRTTERSMIHNSPVSSRSPLFINKTKHRIKPISAVIDLVLDSDDELEASKDGDVGKPNQPENLNRSSDQTCSETEKDVMLTDDDLSSGISERAVGSPDTWMDTSVSSLPENISDKGEKNDSFEITVDHLNAKQKSTKEKELSYLGMSVNFEGNEESILQHSLELNDTLQNSKDTSQEEIKVRRRSSPNTVDVGSQPDCDLTASDSETDHVSNISEEDCQKSTAETQFNVSRDPLNEDHSDVWDDFDDNGIEYLDISIPVMSQKLTGNTGRSPNCNQFKTPTTSANVKKKKEWVPPSPFTPMPDYDDMNTPLLKREVKKIGVKPVAKKRMITLLKDVYHQTHQYETDHELDDDEPVVAEVDRTLTETQETPASHTDDILSQDTLLSSQDSCTSDLPEESILVSDDTSDSDLQNSPQKSTDIGEKLLSFFTSNQELQMKILTYEPLEIDILKTNLKDAGIKCSMDKLMEFLDVKCIAFTSKNNRKRAQSRRGKPKKSPKKSPKKKT